MNTPIATHPAPAGALSPLAELRLHLSEFADRCRVARWFGALFHVRVASDIVGDLGAQQERIARAAYSAEQSDLEAVRVLESAASDGLTEADRPAVTQAIRLIRASAKRDHAIAEAATV